MQRFGPVTTADSREVDVEVQGSKSLQLSALFTAMMESNAMLREQIDQMEENELSSNSELEAESDAGSQERSSGPRHSRQLHSRSLPARLLESGSHTPRTKDFPSPSAKRKGSVHTASLSSESSGSEAESTGSDGEDAEQNHSPAGRGLREPHRSNELNPSGARLPLSITSVSSTEPSESDSESSPEPENDPFASPGESTIETMWDNFSVEEYAPPLKHKEDSKVRKPVVKTVWSRRVTIPEPFAMTIRDEARPKKKKSRALIAAEQEKLEREVQEELECQKKFRALPVPATTYIPIDEIRIRDEDQLQCGRVAQPIKPFSFLKREEEKQREKERRLEELRSHEQAALFRARPVPQSVLSPRVSEELKEREEYRRILIKVRSQETLARAQLPRSMQEKERRECLKRQRLEEQQRRAFVTKEHTFHPKIRPEVPDHDQLYCQFRQQMAATKEVKPATTPKPFILRTSSTPSRCAHPLEEQDRRSMLESNHILSTSCGPRCNRVRFSMSHNEPHRQPAIPMTEAAKLRRSASERKLAECVEREVESEEAMRRRREQQRQLQSRIIQQVQSCDHSTWQQDKQRERLQELRSVQ